MYDFVFYLVYSQQLKRGKSNGFARYNGSLIVSLTLVIHVMLLFSIGKIFFLDWYRNHVGFVNKSFITVFVLSFMILVFFYYNANKADEISRKYIDDKRPSRLSNILKIIVIAIFPLAISIVISQYYKE